MDVGIRELKARLSEFVDRAAAGEDLVVTDRGRPVARLVRFSSDSAVDRGVEDGWIEPPTQGRLVPVARARAEGSVLAVLDEDRG